MLLLLQVVAIPVAVPLHASCVSAVLVLLQPVLQGPCWLPLTYYWQVRQLCIRAHIAQDVEAINLWHHDILQENQGS